MDISFIIYCLFSKNYLNLLLASNNQYLLQLLLKGEQYDVQFQQLKLQIEVQQKIISDYEAAKVTSDKQLAEMTSDLAVREQEAKVFREEMHGKKRLEILLQDMREKLQHLECENRNLQERLNESSPLTDHQKELLLQRLVHQ